jgi:hypothetical protein
MLDCRSPSLTDMIVDALFQACSVTAPLVAVYHATSTLRMEVNGRPPVVWIQQKYYRAT